jgi:hypothetical protein
MMVNLTPILSAVLLSIHFLVHSAESVLNESRRLRTNETRMNDRLPFASPSNKYIRTGLSESLAFKVPPKISHPSISLQSISSNLFMQLVAGTNTSGYSGENGPATAAQLHGAIPFVDSTGNIYIPEFGNYRIRKINQAGIITTFGGTGTSSTAGTSGPIGSVNLYVPWSVVGDSVGTFLYISDEHYVWKYLFSTGIVSVIVGTSTSGFSGDSGPATSAQLFLPTGLWLTTADVLYIADTQNHRIRKVSSGIITTVAGSGCTNNCVGSYSGDNGPATTATLYAPVGNYMDTSGKLYFTDFYNVRIRLVDTNNIITTFAGSGSAPFNGDNIQALSANLNYPYDVKGDSLGNIYIADLYNCIIRMVDATGIISTVFGTPGSCGFSSGISSRTSVINGPYGIWLDSLSNIYFSDSNSVHRSIVVSPTASPTVRPTVSPTIVSPNLFMRLVAGSSSVGNSGTSGGPATSAQIRTIMPWVDSNGNIYIPDSTNSKIRKVGADGIIINFGGTGTASVVGASAPIQSVSFNYPFAIVGDSAGNNLYISDEWYVWKFTFASNIISVFAHSVSLTQGFSGDNVQATLAQLYRPSGLWLTTSGMLYIADYYNNRIRKVVVSSGIITTMAGSGSYGGGTGSFSGDGGPATSATLSTPLASWLDSNGKMFIADYTNRRIRLVDTNNIITTFAGTGFANPINFDSPTRLSANIDAYDLKGDTSGNIYVADYTSCTVRIINVFGIVSTLLGTPGACGFSPGISSRTSSISAPTGVWLDSLSNIYVSDVNSIHLTMIASSPTSQPSRQPTGQPTHQPTCQPTSFISGSLTQGLVAYYPFDGNAQDQSGNGNNGEVHYADLVSDRFGNLNSAFSFDGSSSYIEVVNGSPFNFVGDFSFSMWINPTNPQNLDGIFISKINTATNSGWIAQQDSSFPLDRFGFGFHTAPNVYFKACQSLQFVSNNWNLLTVVKLGITTSCYINTELVRTSQAPSIVIASTGNLPLIIGSLNGGHTRPASSLSQFFHGLLDDIFIYNRTLTANEITKLYEFGSPSSQPTNQPTRQPTTQPSSQPSKQPVSFPTTRPSVQPTGRPSRQPSSHPTVQPFSCPSSQPSSQPSAQPTSRPSRQPTSSPTRQPSDSPSSRPTIRPTRQPTSIPSRQPTSQPTLQPTCQPTSFISGSLNQGLVAYYPFDGNARDQSGNGNNGEVHNATLTTDRFGNPNSAYSFDGSGSYIKVVNGVPFDFSNIFSVAFWISPSTVQNTYAAIISKSWISNGGSSWVIEYYYNFLDSVVFTYRTAATNSWKYSNITNVVANHWNHYAVVKENTKLSSYLNGNLVATAFATYPAIKTNGDLPLFIGNAGPTNGQYFKGVLDDIFIFNRTLTAQEVLKLYQLGAPTSQPTGGPTSQPSKQPSIRPTNYPSNQPTSRPSLQPVGEPTSPPTKRPSTQPTQKPSSQPSNQPTSRPSRQSTTQPSIQPSGHPTAQPSCQPSSIPTVQPSLQPFSSPTSLPSIPPSHQPVPVPSGIPSIQPTGNPSDQPTALPSVQPSCVPSIQPTGKPSLSPGSQPSDQPTSLPTETPSRQPSGRPTSTPSIQASAMPTGQPSTLPTSTPTSQPTLQPTRIPSILPSSFPSSQPSRVPTSYPTSAPSQQPSSYPSSQPTLFPSNYPACIPTLEPTGHPTRQPSSLPTGLPSEYPSSQPSIHPTSQPSSLPSSQTTIFPTNTPTTYPSSQLSLRPSTQPSSFPSILPSGQPSTRPSFKPSCTPFSVPSIQPTSRPSAQPSGNPTKFPTTKPSRQPSSQPTMQPSRQPSSQPICKPSCQPSSRPSSQPTSSPISSSPTSNPTIITESPTPLRNPSISAYPSQTRKPTRQPITPRPTAIPTVRPSYIPTSAPTQTSSVFPSENIHFKGSLFFFGSYLPTVENIPNIYLTEETIGSSYIIFGGKRMTNEIIIGSRSSQGLYSTVMNDAGLIPDHAMSRTALSIGDFNGDTYEDLLICDPINSCCFLSLGHVNGLQNLQVSFAIKSNRNDLFGWSIAKLNDVNKDNYADIAISGLSSNVIYLFFGSKNTADINIDLLDPSVGIKIIGSQNDQNSGLALSSAGDFNNDGHSDILFSAIQINPYQNVIYILFLNSKMMKQNIIDNLTPDKDYFKITAPLFSFAGFSLANLDDINQDGFDDIIIGSIPYSGKYLTQKSYVIYGRNASNTLSLSEITEEEGFIITGGGFMVGGPGDVNGDGIPDIMVSSYQQWQGKGNSYIMVYPLNVTSPPTFLPSSQPTSSPSLSPSVLPSLIVHDPSSTPTCQETTNEPVSEGTFPPFLEATVLPSLAPKTSKPTRIPSIKSTTHCPTFKTDPPSLRPSRKPTETPTRRPTILPSTTIPSSSPTRHPISSTFPTSSPSTLPTESLTEPFEEITIEKEGVYNVPSGKANYIISGEGSFEITSNGGGKKVYTILPSKNVIKITDFNIRYDQISLIHFPYLYSVNDLVYRTNPLQIFLSSEQKLILSSLDASELTEDNFIFQKSNENQKKKTNFHLDLSAVVSLGILIGCVGIFGCVTKLNQTDVDDQYTSKEKENVQRESDKELNEKLSSDFGSFLLSSSDSEREDEDDEFSITNSSNRNEEERDLFENDWNLLSSLQSFFSSDNDSVETLEDKIESVLDVFNVFDPEEEKDQSFVFTESGDEQESDDGNIDIEGNYKNNDRDSDMEEDISLTQFNNSLREKK